MKMLYMKRWKAAVLCAVAFLMLVACGNNAAENVTPTVSALPPSATPTEVPTQTPTAIPTDTPTPEPVDPEKLVVDAFANYETLASVKINIMAEGNVLDLEGACSYDFVLDRGTCQQSGQQDVGDLPTDRVLIGSHLWVKNVGTHYEWVQLQDIKAGFNGIVNMDLVEEIGEVQESKLNGRPVYKVDVVGDVEAILRQYLTSEVTAVQWILDADRAEAKGVIWIDQEAHQILRTDTDIIVDDFEASVTYTYSEFNEPVDVPVPLDEEFLQLVRDYILGVTAIDVAAVGDVVSTRFQENVTIDLLEELRREEYRTFIDFEDIFVLAKVPLLTGRPVSFELHGLLIYEGTDRKGFFSAVIMEGDESWEIDEIELYADILSSPGREQINVFLDTFFNHMEVGEREEAWSLFAMLAHLTPGLYEEFILSEDFTEFVQGYEFVELTSLMMTNSIRIPHVYWGEFALVEGFVVFNDERKQEFVAVLEFEDGEWWLLNIQFQ